MPEVLLNKLTKEFPALGGKPLRAVDELALQVRSGELMVLVGPSGCGKSTLLRMVAGLELPTSGDISFGGKSVINIPPSQRDVAMVFQNHALFPHLTAGENIQFGLKIRKLSVTDLAARFKEAVEMVGLGDCIHKMPRELSGGQRQRVALARALARRANILLLDEPLSHLDAPARVGMRHELLALHRHFGMTMIYVTHDQAEAMSMGQRIAVMESGRIRQVGQPLEVYQNPANTFVARFLGTPPMNLLRGKIEGNNLQIIFAPNIKDADGDVALGIRPEELRLLGGSGSGADTVCFTSIVDTVEQTGAESFIYATVGQQKLIVRLQGGSSFVQGQTIRLGCDVKAVKYFDARSGEARYAV